MPADPNRAESIFHRARELAPAERAAFLAVECSGDTELRAGVERLLAAHDELAEPATSGLPPHAPTATFGDCGETEGHTPGPDGGTVIAGKYKLIEEIGEGGMGSVWMAQQTEPVRRFVAVKLIKAGMDSKAVLARFEAERQVLALMDHPNIARVLDAGAAADGRPYFVMELVKGVPITRFCDERKLTPRERLELFVPVCQAIQHAHQKGIIHRDIKPTNVLIALYDDKPVPKVIDFGVAKAAGQQLTDKTLATGFGAVVGTPEYMSPEQASFNNLDIDTRSDVYALGVLLYELLAGSPPFSRKTLEEAGLLEIFRIIREQEPPRPSAKLSTAAALPTLSANRGTEAKRLTALLRGELDWIVMKALEKERSRRYETAAGFAADVQRYLAGESVQAVPPSAGYRLRKFFRKNRGPVIAAALVILALVAGVVGATWGLISADDARRAAEAAERNERTERGKADEARRAAERTTASVQIDLDLSEYRTSAEVGLLGLARTLKTIPPDSQALREFVVASILLGGQTRAPLRRPITHDGTAVERGRLSPDGRTLLTLGEDATARLWEVPTGRPIAILRRGDERVANIGFSPDGKTIFTDGRDGIARLWNTPEGTYRAETAPRPHRYDGPPDTRWGRIEEAVDISNDRLLTVNVSPGQVHEKDPIELWDTRSGKLIARLDTSESVSWFDRPQFLAGGRWIIGRVGDDLSTALVFSADDGRLVGRLPHPPAEGGVNAVWASPGGRWLVTRCSLDEYESRYRLWDAESGRLDSALTRNEYGSSGPTFLGDDVLAFRDGEGSTTLYQRGRAEPIKLGFVRLNTDVAPVGGLALGSRGEVVSTRTWQRLMPPRGRRYHPDLVRFAPDGRFARADDLIDTSTDKEVVPGPIPERYRPEFGFVSWFISVSHRPGVVISQFVPTRLNLDPELVELWLQVALCGELDPDGRFVKWDKDTWEQKRRELASLPAPYADFPFPGHLASDQLHWLRREFAVARDVASELRLARELVRRAEATGDRDEAVRWRAVVEAWTPQVAPPPREAKR